MNRQPEQSDGYRPEIDGLRAVSIALVILYHTNVRFFSGGYVGVDVFFVISGYLITRNILSDLDNNEFSLTAFYIRRLRRLFPAFLFTLSASFIIGALWFPPDLFRAQSRDTVAALAGVSNISFWRIASDYFGIDELRSSPLQHTWSLAVEEQFYLVWAVGIALLARFGMRKAAPIVFAAVTLISFAAGLLCLKTDALGAFYLTQYRMFELGIGAVLSTLRTSRCMPFAIRETSFALGLAGIIYAGTTFGASTTFPGANALVPCLSAALVIWAGSHTVIGALLRNRLLVALGLISYSLYLCHWPLIVFANWMFGRPHGFAGQSLLVFLAIAAGAATYTFIERPLRFRWQSSPNKPNVVFGISAFAGLVLLCPALLATVQGGWPWRIGAAQRELNRLQSFGYAPCIADGRPCVFGASEGANGLIIVGDSYAQHLVAGLDTMLQKMGLKGLAVTYGGCLMLNGMTSIQSGRPIEHCVESQNGMAKLIESNPGIVVISQSWLTYGAGTVGLKDGTVLGEMPPAEMAAAFKSAIEATLKKFGDRKFLIIGAQPFNACGLEPFQLQSGPLWRPVALCPPIPASAMHAATDVFNETFREIARRYPDRVSVLIPTDYLCDDNCPLRSSGAWLYRDKGHFTVAGAEFLAHRAAHFLQRVIRAGSK